MNKVELLGRLTRDPDIRFTSGDNPTTIARYTLAVDRRIKKDDENSADFISCIAFGKNAEFVRVESSSASFEKASGNMSNYAYLNKFAFEKGVVDKNVMLEKVAVANAFAESQTNA